MANISFGNRIKTIFDLIMSQSFFITLFVIFILTIIILVVNIKIKSKVPRYISIIACLGIGVLVLARYGSYLLSLNDSIVDKFFRAAYFPNVVVYFSMLIITVLLLAYVLIDDRFTIYTRITTFLSFFMIWFLFVLVVDTVKKEKLSFSEVKELYANKDVMILLQASMFVFIIWCSITIGDMVVRKLAHRMDEKERLSGDKSKDKKDFNQIIDKLKELVSTIKLGKDRKSKKDIEDYSALDNNTDSNSSDFPGQL